MQIFGLAGWSGSGKTTLLTRIIPELTGRGYAVSTVKHAHHKFDIDTPGKDSHRHRSAGATEVMIASAHRWALMHENRHEEEPRLEELVERMTPVDLVLIEGFKTYPHDKLEVHRPSVGKPLLAPGDGRIVAIATDARLSDIDLPVLDLDDIAGIADFIVGHCELRKSKRRGSERGGSNRDGAT